MLPNCRLYSWSYNWRIGLFYLLDLSFFWLPDILICHCTSLSPWFIILDMNNFVKVSPYYWIPIWAPMYSILEWQFEGRFFLAKILQNATQRDPQKFIFPYKQVSGRNGDREWLRMTNAFHSMWFIIKSSEKIMQWTEKEALRGHCILSLKMCLLICYAKRTLYFVRQMVYYAKHLYVVM